MQVGEELWSKLNAAKFKLVEGVENDEVEWAKFTFQHDHPYRGSDVYCERFLKINQADADPFAESQLRAKTEKSMQTFRNANPRPPDQAIQYTMAQMYLEEFEKKKEKGPQGKKTQVKFEFPTPGDHWALALTRLYPLDKEARLEIVGKFDAASRSIDQQKGNLDSETLEYALQIIVSRWKFWSGHCFKDRDNAKAHEHLASCPGLLRIIPDSSIYIAVDNKNHLLVYLDPFAMKRAFDNEIKARVERDTEDFYSLKLPIRNESARTTSQTQNQVTNNFRDYECGVDHYGNWHATGQEYGPMVEARDSSSLPSTYRQLLLYYLESTGGTLTRLLDFQFGFLAPKLRAEYREVYRESPKFAKLPPTNGPKHEETYCLRAYLVNMATAEHGDKGDWKGGLAGIVQVGDFRGPGMVFRHLGIVLAGYQSGAAIQLRGTILDHYVGTWTGKSRYVFDHTTHEKERKTVRDRQQKALGVSKGDSHNKRKSDDDPHGATDDEKSKDDPATKGKGRRGVGVTKRKRAADTDAGGDDDALGSPMPDRSKKAKVEADAMDTEDVLSQTNVHAGQQPQSQPITQRAKRAARRGATRGK
ncbi:MAG: hypothetical protein Q9184_004222 [Pyrenodesmia sp. 2 TL-2023]